MSQQLIKGISICHPVKATKEYMIQAIKYANQNGIDHIQYGGPMHDHARGNIDGMTMYRKYNLFNSFKDEAYIKESIEILNEACRVAKESNIKFFAWHHELFLPTDFKDAYPEILNENGDIEVSHPIVQDFIENKVADFFHSYPLMDGIVLTLHETQVPLLKLKNQKLGKIERVKHVTKILFDSCRALGKELIVRPFASTDEDYEMMTKAYEEISPELVVMDKWTQFDWSLTMPSNPFFNKIKNNPLFVEADIFGEYFGKGRLPIMLRDHLAKKFEYSEKFSPLGYAARIDRANQIPFGDVNEVNLHIYSAHLNGKDPEDAINTFFESKYPGCGAEVRDLMEKTENVLIKSIYIKGYLFSELSIFPRLNHCINHYYFEMMKEGCNIQSNEWYIPKGWKRSSADEMIKEKADGVEAANAAYEELLTLKDKIEASEYEKLLLKFTNLKYVAKMWQLLLFVHMSYARYFETNDEKYETELMDNIQKMLDLSKEATKELGDKFYCNNMSNGKYYDLVGLFTSDVIKSFNLEKIGCKNLASKHDTLDYVLCGGACEGHVLQKEVNFSDTIIKDDSLCRIPGNRNGMKWSAINAHGWFSFEMKVKPNCANKIEIVVNNDDGQIEFMLTINGETHKVSKESRNKETIMVDFAENHGYDTVRVRIDKVSGYAPCVYSIRTIK